MNQYENIYTNNNKNYFMKNDFKKCPKCNKLNDKSAKFCNDCGFHFSNENITLDILNYSYFNQYLDNDEILDFYNSGNYVDSLQLIDENLKSDSYNSNLWALKSYILYKLDYFEDALYCCDASLNLNDLNEFSWICKTLILIALNQKYEANIIYNEFLSLNINFNEILNLIDYFNQIFYVDLKDIDINVNEYYNNKEHNFELNTVESILNEDQILKFKDNPLTNDQYNEILDNIKKTSFKVQNQILNDYFIDLENLSIKDKILFYTLSFSHVDFKKKGDELGKYKLNHIYVDDMIMYDSDIITTLIHELSHHVLSEIFEQIFMCVLDTSKTSVVEKVVLELLTCDDFDLIDEYCAHSVQNRFSPYGYQDFASFISSLQNTRNKNDLDFIIAMGNTFSEDICEIFESFIDFDLREDIKQQFKEDKNSDYSYDFSLEKDIIIPEDLKIISINKLILDNLKNLRV